MRELVKPCHRVSDSKDRLRSQPSCIIWGVWIMGLILPTGKLRLTEATGLPDRGSEVKSRSL